MERAERRRQPGGEQSGGGISDFLADLFKRPVFLSFTIGIPFCMFKLLFGITAARIAVHSGGGILLFAGLATGAWALSDLAMNVGRAILDLFHRQARFEYCTIAQVGAFFGMPSVFLAVDTLITFLIICAMLWSGWITRLSPMESSIWYAATTLNLVSLSLVLLHAEIRGVQSGKRKVQ